MYNGELLKYGGTPFAYRDNMDHRRYAKRMEECVNISNIQDGR